MIDANDFKLINDTYGHQCGDWALAKISEAILNVYSKVGFCYRIGGDEFCVILRQNVLKTYNEGEREQDTYAMLDGIMKEPVEILEASELPQVQIKGINKNVGNAYGNNKTC